MSGLLQSLVWRGISEYLLVHQDIKRFRGKKNVVAVMALDRNHPEFSKAEEMYKALGDPELAFVTEDHPRGPIHERLSCGDQEFCFVVLDKRGDVVMKENHAVPLDIVKSALGAGSRPEAEL